MFLTVFNRKSGFEKNVSRYIVGHKIFFLSSFSRQSFKTKTTEHKKSYYIELGFRRLTIRYNFDLRWSFGNYHTKRLSGVPFVCSSCEFKDIFFPLKKKKKIDVRRTNQKASETDSRWSALHITVLIGYNQYTADRNSVSSFIDITST